MKRDFDDAYLWVLAENDQVYRINSLTWQTDDYSRMFSAFDNLAFIDIAGVSKDTVFIATNSLNLIQFKNGAIKLINDQNGIPDFLTSIGIDFTEDNLNYSNNIHYNNHLLMIGTKKGLYNYDIATEMLSIRSDVGADNAYSQIFEASYRKGVFIGSTNSSSAIDTIKYLPMNYTGPPNNGYSGYIWQGGNAFGININTIFETSGILDPQGYSLSDADDIYWGNDGGMFNIYAQSSYYSRGRYGHHLDGITVNKITSIYGLTSFGDPDNPLDQTYVRENLLIGTKNGFYYSTSINKDEGGKTTENFQNFLLFHYDPLGALNINDICVNAIKTQPPVCENGLWLATDNGLYFLAADYAQSVSERPIQAISFSNQPSGIAEMSICTDSSAVAVIDSNTFGSANYNWYKDGQLLGDEHGKRLTIKQAGTYYVLIYDPCSNIKLESNHLKVDVLLAPSFTFNYPDELQYCVGTPVTLRVTGSTFYQYRWYKDDILTGDNTPYQAITQTGRYKVEVSACTGSWVTSKEVRVNFVQVVVPGIKADKPAYCTGENATLSVVGSIDPNNIINWYKDGILIPRSTGQTSTVTNASGNYLVVFSYDNPNTDGSTCSQASINQSIIFAPPPTVSIEKIVNNTICNGQTINLKANYNGGTVQWSTGETTDQISVTQAGIYTATITSTAGCQSVASMDIAFLPNPVFSVNDTTICTYKKQVITLSAPAGFAQYAWNGQTGNQTYQVSQPQTVSLTVTDANGCQATQQIKVADQCPNIYIPNTFTPNGDSINDTWVIEGLGNDPSSTVKVFTRNGVQVFNSIGYGTPWNGEYKGQKLPAGAYYYIVTAKNGTQKFSGSLTIIY